MDEYSGVSPPPAGPQAGTSRRWFLAGGAAVLVGGGAGVVAELLTSHDPAGPPPAPPALIAAASAERALIADLDATTGGTAAVRQVIVAARADHAAHLAALTRLLRSYHAPAGPTAARPQGTPRTLAQLRSAETRASAAAVHRAATLGGITATLLASIAACEATHAALLQ
ncbi:MAG TPA: hypothetical protein VKB75_05875 [Jatrophihabitans sp.]|nr:hypothetical protein [Jatrophihabitans sp.]